MKSGDELSISGGIGLIIPLQRPTDRYALTMTPPGVDSLPYVLALTPHLVSVR